MSRLPLEPQESGRHGMSQRACGKSNGTEQSPAAGPGGVNGLSTKITRSMEKGVFSTNSAKKLDVHTLKRNCGPYLALSIKINSKWITVLNIRAETILCDFSLGKDLLDKTSYRQFIKQIDKLGQNLKLLILKMLLGEWEDKPRAGR